jgi:hypothetical protein
VAIPENDKRTDQTKFKDYKTYLKIEIIQQLYKDE